MSPNDFSVFLKIAVTITIHIHTLGNVSKKHFRYKAEKILYICACTLVPPE